MAKVTDLISAALAGMEDDEREEARTARRREIRAELAKIPSGTPTTAEIDALFDELETLTEDDSA